MRKNRIIFSILAALMAVIMIFCATGCSDMTGLMQNYMTDDTEYLDEGEDIYSLSMFDELPSDYADIDPLFWVAEGKSGNHVYFLGSIHCADKTAYRIPEDIMNAYLASDALAVECNTLAFENDLMAQFGMAQYYMYTDGSTIKDHISPELYKELSALAKEYSSEMSAIGYTTDTLEKCKPSVWMSLFDNIAIEKAGLDSFMGIDYHFLHLATSQRKQIIELESVEFQTQMLEDFSDRLQELLLWDYVENDLDEYAKSTYDLYDAWKHGDPGPILGEEDEEFDYSDEDIADLYDGSYDLAEVEKLSEEYNYAMLGNRNPGMIDKAEKMIDGGQNVFYIVGLAHMLGEEGIIANLIADGYKVTQIGGKDSENYVVPSVEREDVEDDEDLPTSTNFSSIDEDDYDDYYDLYVDMYEYFGGTTARTSRTTTTKATTTRTSAGNSNSDDGWGGWGSSDGD